jgi:RNA polymerase sigma-70 factor (ECF subfamily)
LRARYLPTTPETADIADARIQIAQIMRHVRPELQDIAIYHWIDELKQEEIAELLGVSRRTIDNRLDEFRAELARAFEAEAEAIHVPTI